LGFGLVVTFLLLVTIGTGVIVGHPLINHHFTASELLLPIAIALVFGVLGAGVEYGIKEEKE
jgi:hypothetical protein